MSFSSHISFTSDDSLDGVVDRSFAFGDIPGVLWSPSSASGSEPAPLVLMGHPGGLHKRAPGLVARARHLATTQGFHVATIDSPGHGDRPRSSEDADWVAQIGRARRADQPLGPIVSEFNALLAERAVPEWRAVLDALLELPEIDASGPVGYSGMTVATEIGMRLLVTEPRIGAAVLGGAFQSEGLLAVAREITVPVQYLLPWDDTEIDRESGIAIFDALGSTEKVMHVFPGPHQKVPWSETEQSAWFFGRQLRPAG